MLKNKSSNEKKKSLANTEKCPWFKQPSTSQIGEEPREAKQGIPLSFSFATANYNTHAHRNRENMAAMPFPQISIDCFVMSLAKNFLHYFLLVSGITSLTTAVMECKNCATIWRKRTRGCFCKYSLHLNGKIVYLDLSHFNEIWPKQSLHLNAPKYVRFF